MTTKPFIAAAITPAAELTELELDASDLLPSMYPVIGGDCDTVEPVDLSPTLTMWVDEDGIYHRQPINLAAIEIGLAFGLRGHGFLGTAVFTGGTDDDGNTLPLSDDDLTVLRTLLA